MATAAGIITVVQEGRFQLALEQGGTRLFILAHNAPIDPGQLTGLRDAKTHVAVEFHSAGDLTADAACAIEETLDLNGKASR